MSRATISIAVVLGIATTALLLVDRSRAAPVEFPEVLLPSAKVES